MTNHSEMIFAIFSDVHANYPALRACINHWNFYKQGFVEHEQQVIVLGDTLDAGPMPCETLELLKELQPTFILGNHEDYIFEHIKNPKNQRYLDPLWRMIPWAANKLGFEQCLDFKKECKFSAEFLQGKIHFVHASFEGNNIAPQFFPEQMSLAPKLPLPFQTAAHAVYFFGHTHYAGIHKNPSSPHESHFWVNCGSVGYPFFLPQPHGEKEDCSFFAEKNHFASTNYVTARAKSLDDGRVDVAVNFHQIPYLKSDYVAAALTSGFYENCKPFSRAIAAQTLFNADITYPFFRMAKQNGWHQHILPDKLMEYLDQQGWSARLRQLGL